MPYRSVGDIEVTLDMKRLQQMMAWQTPRANELLDASAERIKEGWKNYIIVKHVIDTGDYLRSIHIENPGELTRIISDKVHYGVYQEFGTIYISARPTGGPAVEDERPIFLKAWKALFR